MFFFFFSSRRRHTRCSRDWSSDVCSSDLEDVAQTFEACQSEAGSAFGSAEIYCEKYVEGARHVEVQVLGDNNGIRLHLGERECSVQRRHQKLLEESPAPNLGAETRSGLHRAALTVAAAVN